MDRRGFVRTLPVVAGAVAALGASACGGATYLVPRELGGRLAVSVDTVGDGAFVAHPASDRPIFVSRAPDGGWIAVHARCTHRGCQPEPVAERLVCPCHGSEFALDGRVLEGPARDDLTRLPVRVSGSDLVIELVGAGT